MKSRYLVTGGAGFIGCHLVEELVSKREQVLVYDNLSFGKLKNIRPFLKEITFVRGDINDNGRLYSTIKKFHPDVVIHLAALHFIPYCNRHPEKTVCVNIDGTHNLLRICSKYKPRKVLFASSAAVYQISDRPHTETEELIPSDIYGTSKVCGEALLRLFAMQTSIPAVACRFSNVYGPKETNDHAIPHITKQLKARISRPVVKIGNATPKRDYIYVEDIARALVTLAAAPTGPYAAFNVGTGFEYSVEEIIEKISSIIKKKIHIRSMHGLVRKVDQPHLCSNIKKITTLTGWVPRYDIDAGLRALIEFELRPQGTVSK